MQLTLEIPEDLYRRLALRAIALSTTVEALATPVLAKIANDLQTNAQPSSQFLMPIF
jgi:hypothetical protein